VAESRVLSVITLTLAILTGQDPAAVSAQQPGEADLQVAAGNLIVLDLDQALRFALDQSWRMERLRLDLERDTYNLEASRAGLRSNASMSFTLPNFDQSIKEIIDPDTGDPIVLSTRGARYSGSLSIRQPLPSDGVVSLNGVLNRTTDDLFSFTPGRKTYYGRVYLRYEQPILQPNRIQLAIRRAELQLENTEISFLQEQIDIINDTSNDYFELFERTYQEILAREERDRLEQLYTLGRQLFQRGIIPELDLLALEIDLTSRRDRASSSAGRLTREKANFKLQIGIPQEREIEVRPVLTYTPVDIDVDLATERALEHRPDMRRNEISMEYQVMDLEERRSSGSIRGTVSLTLGLEGRDETMDDFYQAITDPDQARGAAVNFTVPLWDWGRNRARINARLAEMEKVARSREQTEISIRRTIRNAVGSVVEAQDRLGLLVRSVDASDRAYQQSLQQFEAGALNVQDLLLTQGRLAEARRSYLNAYISYRRSLVSLTRNTYWDWEKNQPLRRTLAAYIVENGERRAPESGDRGTVP